MTQEYILINDIPAKLYRAQSPRGTVIAVHGFGGSKESYAIKSLAERVTANGLCVLTFDLPLHGERGGDCSALAIDRLIGEITAAEQYALDNIGGELYAFATSFGGMSMLHRTEQKSDPYKKIDLRVPAVNMAQTLITISTMSDPEFTLEKAKEQAQEIIAELKNLLSSAELSDGDLFAARATAKKLSTIDVGGNDDQEEIIFTGEQVDFDKLKVGDVVFSQKMQVQVRVVDIRSKSRIRVRSGNITTEVKADDLYYSVAEVNKKRTKHHPKSTSKPKTEINTRRFENEINVIGQRSREEVYGS